MGLFGGGDKKDVLIKFSSENKTKGDFQQVERDTKNVGSAASGSKVGVLDLAKGFAVAQIAMKAFDAAMSTVNKGLDFMSETLQRGASLDMLNKSLDVVAENAGVSQKELQGMRDELAEVNTWGSKASKVLRSMIQTGTLNSLEDMGISFSDLTLTMKDFAATAQVSSGQAIDDFTTAIQRLSPELLEKYFTMRNLTFVYEEYADKLGIASAELTEVQKREAFLQEIMKEGERVKGVYNETYDTAGKNMLSLADAAESTQEILGLALQPAFKVVTNAALKFLKAIRDLINTASPGIEKLSTAVGDKLNSAIQALSGFFTKLWGAMQPVIQTIRGAFTKAVENNAEKIDKLKKSLSELWEIMQKAVIGVWEAIGANEEFGEATEDAATEGVGGFIDFIQEMVNHLKDMYQWVYDNREEIAEFFVTTIKAAGVVIKIISVVVKVFMKVVQFITKIYQKIHEVIMQVEEFVQAVKDGIETAKQRFQEFKDFIATIPERIQAFVQQAIEFLRSLPTRFLEFIGMMIAHVHNFIVTAPEKIAQFVTNAIEKLRNFKDKAVEFFRTLPERLGAFLQLAVQKAIEFKDKAIAKIGEFKDRVVKWFTETLPNSVSSFADKIVEFVRSIPDRIKSALNSLIQKFESAINSIIDGYNKVADEAPGIGSMSHVSLPRLAAGMSYTPEGMYKVHKDEVVALPAGAQVYSAREAGKMAPTVTINVTGNTIDSSLRVDEIVRKVKNALATENQLADLNLA